MPGRLRPLPYWKVDRALRAIGFLAIRQQSSHVRYEDEVGAVVTIPADKHVSRSIVKGLLRFLPLTIERFERLL